jgi:iron complex transport system substrate-binding protein
VDTVADRLGVCEQGGTVVREMRRTILEAQRAVRGRPPGRVVVLEWVDPPFACGHWLPEMAEMAGGEELLGREGQPSRQVTWDDVRAAEPELLVLAACGFGAHRTAEEAGELPLDIPTVAVDANARFSRPAPRVAEGVAQLAHLFHPDVVPDPGYPAVWLRPPG